MFTKQTVFVIGAGAGFEYNMPVGAGLKKAIASRLTHQEDPLWHSMVSIFNLQSQREVSEYQHLKGFMASNMDRAESIDNFLHTHSQNEKLVTIGKVAIAASILDAERGSYIAPEQQTAKRGPRITRMFKETWLSRFCTMALTGVVASDAISAFENVTIVTFNYDRCIEYYLAEHIQAYLGIEPARAYQIVNNINIIHVYGKVGKLPWQNGDETIVALGGKCHPDQLLTVSNEIRTFTERLEEDDTQERIQEAISAAEIVLFTGFSFGTSNWEFLDNSMGGPRKLAIAGLYDVSEPNQRNIANRLRSYLHPGGKVEVEISTKGSLELLNDYSTYF